MAEYYEYITGQGVIVPDTSTVLTEIQNMFKTVFGDDLDLTATTAQGRLIEMFQRNRTFCIQICALVSNMLNLNRATGFVLDDLGSLFLIERQPATYTTTTVILSGVGGTIIPAGTRLQTTDGNIFVNTQSYTIPEPENAGETASITGEFRSEKVGEVPCPANTLTIILDRINGLETVINPSAPTIGRNLESDTEFRDRIKNSLNINSIAIISAIKSNLEAVDGVKDSYCYDNYSSIPVTVDGVVVPPRCILACVEGGANIDVAEVLYKKKTLGTGYIEIVLVGNDTLEYTYTGKTDSAMVWNNGGTPYYTSGTSMPTIGATIYSDESCTVSVTTVDSGINTNFDVITENVIDETYGNVYPVVFIRPVESAVDVNITVSRQNYSGADLVEKVKDAIMQWYNGEVDGVDGIKIGKSVSPFEISAAVSDVIPDIFITDIKVCLHGGLPSANTISFGAVHKATVSRTNITVTVTL